MSRARALVACLFALTLVTGLAGCGKKIIVAQYPLFLDEVPDLKTIAIIPFDNRTGVPEAGQAVSDPLAGNLVHNGTYQVIDRARLGTLMTERDLQIAQGNPGPALQQLQGKAQAILVGSVTTYSATSTQPERRVMQVPRTDRNGNTYYDNVYWTYIRNEAIVSVSAQLLKVPEGTPLGGVGDVVGQAFSESTPPPNQAAPQMSPQTCLTAARNAAIAQLTEQFAVVRKEIPVEKDAIIAARPGDAGRWEKTSKFTAGEPVCLVLKLPQAAHRNWFRVVVKSKDGPTVLDREVQWLRTNPLSGEAIPLPENLPSGEYQVNVYTRFQEKSALDTKFKITEPK